MRTSIVGGVVHVRSIMPHARVIVGVFACACVLLAGACSEVTDALRPSPAPSRSIDPSATPTAGPSVSPGEQAIVVEAPLPGEQVTAPIRVSGTADVVEATVSIRILDAEGVEIAAAFATATCGSGCRGTFSTEIFFFTPERQNGTIEVFESSAEDGSQLHLVRVPVVLVPGA